MKRRTALLALSREHHSALALAKRIATATLETRIELCSSLGQVFRSELEPHFVTEEASLLPLLAATGSRELVSRTLKEHQVLRALAKAATEGNLAALDDFGHALQQHVRFEERVLFPEAEAHLDPAWLDAPPP